MTKKVYDGQLISKGDSNNDLFLDNYENPLNKIIEEDSKKHGNYLMIKYWISDEKLSENELDEKFMDTYYNIEKKDNTFYFEISEFLWKNEGKGCKHDLINELNSYIGKYCRLDINYSKEPETHDKSFLH
ncbi:hypothetical protein [Methanobacterium sp. ACI-7]|uniref:hypothetical protein n=1 Tax=unclassified Methanobacterium TaxID=2627676 RepID=UPI0039C2CE29